jgi:AraC-like DNA-binding protein
VFREVTGQTLHEYRLDLRVRAALEMLESGADLSRVAQDLGFASHSHFTSVFRRRAGMTPSRMRDFLNKPESPLAPCPVHRWHTVRRA